MGERLGERLDEWRLHLARPDALIQLALLGLATGMVAGGVILLFRLAVEGAQAGLLPGAEAYEALPPWLRLALPLGGGALIGWLFHRHGRGLHVLGVARVMERMAYHQGYLSLRESLLQFAGAALTIVSGHSVGREGPHIYLGAAGGSLLGQALGLPNNSIRTLVGCGVAAGIAASFNTPLAGVIFSLEVVMMEYTLASFIPVILAAGSATALSVAVFGAEPAFNIPALRPGSLAELPVWLLLGLVTGSAAALFVQMLQSSAQFGRRLPFWQRTTLAGLVVGAIALWVPQVMGIGYDTVDAALTGGLGLGLLLVLVLAKMTASAACIGLGIPGGMIGPSLFIGAVLGSLVAHLLNLALPGLGLDPGLYALLGMGAMMGASLQAPLAALTAMMELTHSPQLIMPGMLVIVVAGLTASELFRKESLFIAMLRAGGMDYQANPVLQTLRRTGVAGVMSKRFARPGTRVTRERAELTLAAEPEWLLIEDEHGPSVLMPAVDLAAWMKENSDGEVDLLEIPARRYQLAGVELRATLQEALEALRASGAEALYVKRMTAPAIIRIYGVLTREQIESAYHY
ncbi:MAG: chloride channel protein [Candidatus Sedimenticola endophacoides]|uniref:Chloride channel protein n=2 Tax=Candidatus Sedimenticola endophacoides TaxID=2548426 RepID=A0A6N4DSJ6_9GAMM|nr:MAG: chloride channel protein [Candidatus Sedimenticola endophacoides]PUD99825.1 MAG: chloride channel protein [Candidatus Sedimenticola endophacoides]PUE03214.1 MAG: chloride channel protein [Candidatus Sedimenticola endophacoides]